MIIKKLVDKLNTKISMILESLDVILVSQPESIIKAGDFNGIDTSLLKIGPIKSERITIEAFRGSSKEYFTTIEIPLLNGIEFANKKAYDFISKFSPDRIKLYPINNSVFLTTVKSHSIPGGTKTDTDIPNLSKALAIITPVADAIIKPKKSIPVYKFIVYTLNNQYILNLFDYET